MPGGGSAFNVVVADVTDWRPEPDGFDLVVIFYLQLPETEREAVMERARSAVRPGLLAEVGPAA